jgi:hypothetical protein
MVCDALRDFGVQCVTPECLRLAKVEDHSSSVPRLCPCAAPRLPVPARQPARPPLAGGDAARLRRFAALTWLPLVSRLWIALYALSIHLARAGLAREARLRAVREGAAPFPLPRAPDGRASAATAPASARHTPLPLPHPLPADGSGDGSAWEHLTMEQRADAVKAVVRRRASVHTILFLHARADRPLSTDGKISSEDVIFGYRSTLRCSLPPDALSFRTLSLFVLPHWSYARVDPFLPSRSQCWLHQDTPA